MGLLQDVGLAILEDVGRGFYMNIGRCLYITFAFYVHMYYIQIEAIL